jgi:hypothetical protein
MKTTSLTLGNAVADSRVPARAFETMWQALWSQSRVPSPVLELCRLRLAQMHGAAHELEVEHPATRIGAGRRESVLCGRFAGDGQFSRGEVAALSLAEVYAQDPAAITDDMADDVKAIYGDAGLVVLIEALGFIDGRIRMARLMNALAAGDAVTGEGGR